MNKIVSKKAKIREILTANNLDPDKTYIMDQEFIDVEKTILEIVPKSKANLLEAELIIETLPLDLETRHEIRFEPLVKPAEKPFRIMVFNPKTFDITVKKYSDKSIKNMKLEDYSDTYNAYCNTTKELYISGGKNGGKGTRSFWKVNKQNFSIQKLKDLKYPKEDHTMFFVPKKYIYFIGGNTQETFFYNILKDNFEDWGPLNKKRSKPCVALANKSRLYVFDAQSDKKNFEFIERCDLAKGRNWEVLKVTLSEPFPLTNFSAAVDFDNKIYLFGGKKKNKERSYVFDPKEKSIVPFEQENSSMASSDKYFYPINDFNSALIPNIEGDKLNVLLFNRRKKRFKKLKFTPEVEKTIEIKELQNRGDNQENEERMRLLLKRVEQEEKMPDLPDGLIRFPSIDELNAPPKIEADLNVDIKPPSLNVDIPKIEGEIGLPGIDIKGPGIDIKGPEIHAGIGLPNVDIKGPKIDGGIGIPGIDIHGPKIDGGIDIKGPKVDIDINGPKLDGNINANVDINVPQVNLRGGKPKKPGIGVDIKGPSIGGGIGLPGVDIHGPKIDAGIDIKGPKIPGIGVDIKGPKMPGVDIHGPKIDAGIDIKGPKIPGIGVDIHGPKMPGVDIHGPKIDAGIDIHGPKIPGIGVDIQGPKMPGVDIHGPKIDAGIDIKGPKIGGGIGLPGVDIKGPKIDVDIKGPSFGKPDLKAQGPKIDANIGLPSLGAMLEGNADIDINAPQINVPNVDIQGPKIDAGIDIKGPKIDTPQVDIHGNLPSLSGMLDGNANIDINAPKVDIHGPKIDAGRY